jgi:hypothetical protein
MAVTMASVAFNMLLIDPNFNVPNDGLWIANSRRIVFDMNSFCLFGAVSL